MGQGVSLNDTYVKVLEGLLAEQNLDKRIEVINGGTAGYGVWQELALLEEKGLSLEPDLVVFQACPANDVHDALMQINKVLKSYNNQWVTDLAWCRAKHSVITYLAKRCARRSRAVESVFNGLCSPRSPLIPYLRPRFRAWQPSFPPSEDERPWWLETSLQTYYSELEEGWRLVESSIRQMVDLCRQKGIRFSVFVAPIVTETYPKMFKQVMDHHGLNPNMYDVTKNRRLLREICERNGIDFVDIFPRFAEKRDEGQPLYYPLDGHWTPAGHRLCAEVLYEHLLKKHVRELAQKSDEGTT
jgi:lysophospholipase L1-like esterase